MDSVVLALKKTGIPGVTATFSGRDNGQACGA
jgi:hypothetical protein